jgi:putative restriction endonuclease
MLMSPVFQEVFTWWMLRKDSARFTDIYRLLLRAARAEGIDRDRLPGFLDLADGGEFALLGPDELGTSVFEIALRTKLPVAAASRSRQPGTAQEIRTRSAS